MNVKESTKNISRSKKIVLVVISLLAIFSVIVISKFIFDRINEVSKTSDSCVPYGVEVVSKSMNEAKITWKTDKNCISYIKYGLSIEDLPYESISNSSSAKKHEATLSKLQSGFNYYYIIISDSKEYGINGLPLSFSTKAF